MEAGSSGGDAAASGRISPTRFRREGSADFDRLFLTLARNSTEPSEVFAIPPDRVVEMGVQMAL
jgi:K+ transporter